MAHTSEQRTVTSVGPRALHQCSASLHTQTSVNLWWSAGITAQRIVVGQFHHQYVKYMYILKCFRQQGQLEDFNWSEVRQHFRQQKQELDSDVFERTTDFLKTYLALTLQLCNNNNTGNNLHVHYIQLNYSQ